MAFTKNHSIAALLFLFVAGGCSVLWPGAGSLEDRARSIEIPSEFWGNHIFVEAMFDSSRSEYMLLDTGFTVSVIDSLTASSLTMSAAKQVNLTGIGEEKRSAWIGDSPVRIRIPGMMPYESTVPVLDLSEINPFMGRYVHGIIGSDLFFRFVVEIDYATQTVVLHDRRKYEPDPEAIAIPIEIRQNLPYIDARLRISDKMEIKGAFLVDTGSSTTVTLNAPFVKQHNLEDSIAGLKSSMSIGIGGELNTLSGKTERMSIGPVSLMNVPVDLSFSETGEASSAERAGLIGYGILNRFRVTFDYTNLTMYLKKQKHFSEPYWDNFSGITLTAKPPHFKEYRVHHVFKGSPASVAGIREGDKLVAVNGKPAEVFTLPELQKAIYSKCSSIVQLEFKRNDRVFRKTLKFGPYTTIVTP